MQLSSRMGKGFAPGSVVGSGEWDCFFWYDCFQDFLHTEDSPNHRRKSWVNTLGWLGWFPGTLAQCATWCMVLVLACLAP